MPVRKIFAAVFLGLTTGAAAQGIERVEPPHWYTGYSDTSLQLLVYGDNIAGLRPVVSKPGVRVQRIVTTENPNYLFVYLEIGAETRPGEFDIVFSDAKTRIARSYRLEKRQPERVKGFGASDAIYLVTPDRFANGNPDNDSIDGMADRLDRDERFGRHGGDIAGLVRSIGYLEEMGFTALWLNPLLENDMPRHSYHGYATTDFYRVDPRYGSNAEYRDLADAARTRGIGLIMDMIVNHIGSAHWWMSDLPSADWINHGGQFVPTSHERTVWQDPYADPGDIADFADGWFVESMPDLNQRNPLLGDYLVQNALWWIEYLGLAGIRMDTYPYPDKHYMAEWTRRVMQEYPDFTIVGEEWSLNPAIVAYWQRGKVNHDGYVSHLPSVMDFPLQDAMSRGLVEPERPHQSGLMHLYRMLANDFLYADPGHLVIFGDNHDMKRIYSQLGEDEDLYRMAMLYLLTMRGIPQVYYGTEILMSSTDDHGNIRSDFPGGWRGDRVDAFSGRGLSKKQRAAQDYLRQLLQWRQQRPVIHHGELVHFYPQDGVYTWIRYDEEMAVLAALNKGTEAVSLDLGRYRRYIGGQGTPGRDVLAGGKRVRGSETLLPPRGVVLLEFNLNKNVK